MIKIIDNAYRLRQYKLTGSWIIHCVASGLLTGNACSETGPCATYHCENTVFNRQLTRVVSLCVNKGFELFATIMNAVTRKMPTPASHITKKLTVSFIKASERVITS